MEKKFILDPCCGGRHFWFNKRHPNVIYTDIRLVEKGVSKHRPNFEVKPDKIMDFKKIEYPNSSFKLIVFDPPHLIKASEKAEMRLKYGVLGLQWKDDLKLGFLECWRVLEDYGILIFKWNEAQIKLKEILELFPVIPLFGHTTGSKSTTHWLCFMKIPKEELI
jgi:hypothetical protein